MARVRRPSGDGPRSQRRGSGWGHGDCSGAGNSDGTGSGAGDARWSGAGYADHTGYGYGSGAGEGHASGYGYDDDRFAIQAIRLQQTSEVTE